MCICDTHVYICTHVCIALQQNTKYIEMHSQIACLVGGAVARCCQSAVWEWSMSDDCMPIRRIVYEWSTCDIDGFDLKTRHFSWSCWPKNKSSNFIETGSLDATLQKFWESEWWLPCCWWHRHGDGTGTWEDTDAHITSWAFAPPWHMKQLVVFQNNSWVKINHGSWGSWL